MDPLALGWEGMYGWTGSIRKVPCGKSYDGQSCKSMFGVVLTFGSSSDSLVFCRTTWHSGPSQCAMWIVARSRNRELWDPTYLLFHITG